MGILEILNPICFLDTNVWQQGSIKQVGFYLKKITIYVIYLFVT